MRALSHSVVLALAWTLVAAAAPTSSTRAGPPRPAVAAAEGAALPIDAQIDDATRGWFGKPLGKAKGYACFERTYDAAHLARHPLQKVGSMTLLVRGETIPEDPAPNYSFALRMTYKDRSARFVSTGYCGHAGGAAQLRCGVDCDGGSLDVALASDTRSSLVSIERIAVWPEAGGVEEENRAHLDAGADDKSFRLQRVALSRCARLGGEDDIAELRRRN